MLLPAWSNYNRLLPRNSRRNNRHNLRPLIVSRSDVETFSLFGINSERIDRQSGSEQEVSPLYRYLNNVNTYILEHSFDLYSTRTDPNTSKR
jgi:hypothetical protein